MATDSSTAGYLAPLASPVADVELDDALHDVVQGITGVQSNLVRPRWQPEPPQRPELEDDWIAFGIVNSVKDQTRYEGFDGNEEVLTIESDEMLTVLHSFYGPHASAIADRYRDGLTLDQNRWQLVAQNMAVIEVQDAVSLPALLAERWAHRIDVRVIFRRRTSRTYKVRSLTSAGVSINNEQYETPIVISN